MTDEPLFRLRPGDLATVWATAFEQMIEFWRAGISAFLEAGKAEDHIIGSHCNEISVPAGAGGPPRLVAGNLVGDTFRQSIDGRLVTFTVKAPGAGGFVVVECCIDETQAQTIDGDTYRGDVFDARGSRVACLVIDAGS